MKKLVYIVVSPHRKSKRLLTLLSENRASLIHHKLHENKMHAVMDAPTFKSIEKAIDDAGRYVVGRVVVVETAQIEENGVKWLERGKSPERVAEWVIKQIQKIPIKQYRQLTDNYSPSNYEKWNEIKRVIYHLDRIPEEIIEE